MDRYDPVSNDTDLTSSGIDDESPEPPINAEVLVEEISIDGMCGVY